jgi:hypothetical protein
LFLSSRVLPKWYFQLQIVMIARTFAVIFFEVLQYIGSILLSLVGADVRCVRSTKHFLTFTCSLCSFSVSIHDRMPS